MTRGDCHCGAVRLQVPTPPEVVSECNCSICRRIGGLWAYYPPGEVTVSGPTVAYVQGDRTLALHHCPACGCTTHWLPLDPGLGRMGVNARMLDGFDAAAAERRGVDGASW